MATFSTLAEQVNASCRCVDAPEPVRQQVLSALRAFATTVDLTEGERRPVPEGYIARELYRDPAGWSVAAVVLRPGQQTPPHDHESWGCAATVAGVERNRRFVGACPDHLRVIGEEEVPVGAGYCFADGEIHQAVGADPDRVTISLHFLVQGSHTQQQRCPEPAANGGTEQGGSRSPTAWTAPPEGPGEEASGRAGPPIVASRVTRR